MPAVTPTGWLDAQVFVPFIDTDWIRTCLGALRQQMIAAHPVFTGGDYTYAHLIEERWQAGETFIIVEDDILVWPGGIDALLECPEPWCSLKHMIGGGWASNLGCTKFDASLLVGDPWAGESRPVKNECDGPLARMLQARGFVQHFHGPAVLHMNAAHWPTSYDSRWDTPEHRTATIARLHS